MLPGESGANEQGLGTAALTAHDEDEVHIVQHLQAGAPSQQSEMVHAQAKTLEMQCLAWLVSNPNDTGRGLVILWLLFHRSSSTWPRRGCLRLLREPEAALHPTHRTASQTS